MKARVFVVANQKGGVGKTSIAVNLCASLAHYGRRALLVDLDPQGNATTGSGIDKGACDRTVYGVLLGEYPVTEAVRRSDGGYDVVPSNRELAGAEVELISIERREYRLRDGLQSAVNDYDFVVIDCPPALNMLTVNGFAAADAVIIPMQCEYYALEGLRRGNAQGGEPESAHRDRGAGTHHVRPSTLTAVSDELKRHYGDKVFDTVIPRNIRIAEAPSFGKPVLQHDPTSKGAIAHLQFARELLARNGIKVAEAA